MAAAGAAAILICAMASVASADSRPLVRPWGDNVLRVTFCAGKCDDTLPGALDLTPPTTNSLWREASETPDGGMITGSVVNGNIRANIVDEMLLFTRLDDGMLLLKQTSASVPVAATGGSVTFDFSSSATTVYGSTTLRHPTPALLFFVLLAPFRSNSPPSHSFSLTSG